MAIEGIARFVNVSRIFVLADLYCFLFNAKLPRGRGYARINGEKFRLVFIVLVKFLVWNMCARLGSSAYFGVSTRARAHVRYFMTQNLQNRFENWDGRVTGDSRRCRRSCTRGVRGVEHDS